MSGISPLLAAARLKYERAKAVERVLDAQFIEKMDEAHDATQERACLLYTSDAADE